MLNLRNHVQSRELPTRTLCLFDLRLSTAHLIVHNKLCCQHALLRSEDGKDLYAMHVTGSCLVD